MIGKADRLKLGNKPKRRADMGQKQVRGYGIQVRAKPARKPKKEKKEAPQQKAPKVEVILVPVEPPPRPDTVIPTAALKNRMCRWPYGNPDEPDFGHCGCHTDQGVYCVTHHRVAYRPYVKNYKPLAPIKVNYGKRRA